MDEHCHAITIIKLYVLVEEQDLGLVIANMIRKQNSWFKEAPDLSSDNGHFGNHGRMVLKFHILAYEMTQGRGHQQKDVSILPHLYCVFVDVYLRAPRRYAHLWHYRMMIRPKSDLFHKLDRLEISGHSTVTTGR
jgi:hypothetical protein